MYWSAFNLYQHILSYILYVLIKKTFPDLCVCVCKNVYKVYIKTITNTVFLFFIISMPFIKYIDIKMVVRIAQVIWQ